MTNCSWVGATISSCQVRCSSTSESSPRPVKYRGRSALSTCAPWRIEINMLAYCDMRTLYLRNVPDDVVERLERLAARDSTSVGAVAVRELAEVSRRADNPALLGSLPDLGVDAAAIVRDLDAGRADR